MDWISVDDRLPKDGEIVFITGFGVYGNRFVDRAWRMWDKFIQDPEEVIVFTNVTHWMPIPEPPEAERI